jgi:prolyl-tRNA synthetase
VLRRDRLYRDDGKLATDFQLRSEFIGWVGPALEAIQHSLFAEARGRLQNNVARNVNDLAAHFKGGEDKFVGWVEVQWARPTGVALDKIVARLKGLKLTMRNAPMDAAPADGVCFFTGEKAVERVLVGRTY